jgi:transcriptional regulator GlxA family with amidase domain
MPRQCLAEMPNIPRILPMHSSPHRVEILVYPEAQLLDVAGPLQVLATANELALEAGLPPPYERHVIARQAGSITSSAGLVLMTEPLPSVRHRLNTLLVAGGHGVYTAAKDRHLVRWIARRAGQAARVASVCTGAFLLAEAGLLDGRRVTTHWRRCTELARTYPALRVEQDPIFVRDGDVWTSAGVTAGIDLTLAFVEADVGRAAALAVARHLVVFAKRPGGQAQFSAGLALATDPDFDTLHEWMINNLRQDLSVPHLAARVGMSERSFARRYRAATGTTPSRAVERLRVEAAREALATSRRPVKDIAWRCGFGSEETMRRSFLRVLSVAPRDYRLRFAA